MPALLKNWRSSAAIVPFVVIAWLVHERAIKAEEAIALLGATGAYLAAVSKDAVKP